MFIRVKTTIEGWSPVFTRVWRNTCNTCYLRDSHAVLTRVSRSSHTYSTQVVYYCVSLYDVQYHTILYCIALYRSSVQMGKKCKRKRFCQLFDIACDAYIACVKCVHCMRCAEIVRVLLILRGNCKNIAHVTFSSDENSTDCTILGRCFRVTRTSKPWSACSFYMATSRTVTSNHIRRDLSIHL